ncbi:MAG TPA: DNA primase small subunit domain-containing protein [Candidatus Nanoarchaeia archaeon]|nr:DNA primase small subunit domain-containing protein [Candidatus Nanoarchaeia archaeon]
MIFRPSTLKERERYYREEFNAKDAYSWFRKNKLPMPQLYAMDLGSETKIIRDRKKIGEMLNFMDGNIKKRLADSLPEDVYYDRNRYRNPKLALEKLDFKHAFSDPNFLGQELAFDVDANNFKCACKDVCEICIGKAAKNSAKLAEKLESVFKRIGLVYSGRGIHLHVFDKKAFKLSIKERQEINKEMGHGIDPWVSRGRIRLIRLPYSLNAVVSRKVLPLTIEEALDFQSFMKKTFPRFLL